MFSEMGNEFHTVDFITVTLISSVNFIAVLTQWKCGKRSANDYCLDTDSVVRSLTSEMAEFGVDFIAGSLGGAAGVLAGHPFDTVKVRLQTQSVSSQLRYSGNTFSTIADIARAEGARGLYKGMSSPLASVAFLNAIIFSAHGRVIKSCQRQSGDVGIAAHFAAGAFAGSAQAFIASPMELLKLRVQMYAVPIAPTAGVNVATVYGQIVMAQNSNYCHSMSPNAFLSPYGCFKQILADKGFKGLTRGITATQLRDFTGVGMYFASYEVITRCMGRDIEPMNSAQLLLAGGLAGTFSWLINYPVDVVKTRFQADNSYKNYTQVCRKLYAENGLRTFFIGLESTLLRAFPTNAATFFTVEWMYRLLHRHIPSISASPCDIAPTNANSPSLTIACRPLAADPARSYVSVSDLWQRNSFLLPEAGSTSIDPMIVWSQHGHCRQSRIVL